MPRYKTLDRTVDDEVERLEEALAEAKILLEQRDRRIVGLENRIAELEEKLEETLVRLAKLKIRGVE